MKVDFVAGNNQIIKSEFCPQRIRRCVKILKFMRLYDEDLVGTVVDFQNSRPMLMNVIQEIEKNSFFKVTIKPKYIKIEYRSYINKKRKLISLIKFNSFSLDSKHRNFIIWKSILNLINWTRNQPAL